MSLAQRLQKVIPSTETTGHGSVVDSQKSTNYGSSPSQAEIPSITTYEQTDYDSFPTGVQATEESNYGFFPDGVTTTEGEMDHERTELKEPEDDTMTEVGDNNSDNEENSGDAEIDSSGLVLITVPNSGFGCGSGLGTEPGPLQRVLPHQKPGPLHLGRFPHSNPLLESPHFSLQFSI
jgi:hypothetical protein